MRGSTTVTKIKDAKERNLRSLQKRVVIMNRRTMGKKSTKLWPEEVEKRRKAGLTGSRSFLTVTRIGNYKGEWRRLRKRRESVIKSMMI